MEKGESAERLLYLVRLVRTSECPAARNKAVVANVTRGRTNNAIFKHLQRHTSKYSEVKQRPRVSNDSGGRHRPAGSAPEQLMLLSQEGEILNLSSRQHCIRHPSTAVENYKRARRLTPAL